MSRRHPRYGMFEAPSDRDYDLGCGHDPEERYGGEEHPGYLGAWEDRECVTCYGPCVDRRGAVAGTRCGRCRGWEDSAQIFRRHQTLDQMPCGVCTLALRTDETRMLGLHRACRDRLRAAQRDDKTLSVRRVGLRRA